MEPETMGDRIRLLRKAKGMTLQDLAQAVGVTKAAVWQWERGATENIKLVTFLRLVQVLGTSADYLVHGPDERRRPYTSGRSHNTR